MNKLSKNTKILIGVTGAAVVLVVIGLILGQPGSLSLQGAAGLNVYPAELCLLPGQSYYLVYNNTAAKVRWTIGDSTVVNLSDGSNKGVTVTAQNKVGYITWVSGRSLLGIGGTSEVGVWHLCPNVFSMKPNNTVRYTTDIAGGVWSSSNTSVAVVNSSGMVTTLGTDGQSAAITVTAPDGSQYTSVITVSSQNSDLYWIR